MYQTHYTDSLHQRLDASGYSAAGTDYAPSSTTRSSSFSHNPQQDAAMMSVNPWGSPDFFATDPKLAAFYGDAISGGGGPSAAGVSTMGLDPSAAIHETYDYAGNPAILAAAAGLDYDPSSASSASSALLLQGHQFSPEDIEAIIASGILDNHSQYQQPSTQLRPSLANILHQQQLQQQQQQHPYQSPPSDYSQQQQPLTVADQYVESYLSQLQNHDGTIRVPSLSSLMGLAPSPSGIPSAASSPNDRVIRGDSAILVHSPDAGLPEPDISMDVSGRGDSIYQRMDRAPEENVLTTGRYSLVDFTFHHTLGTGSFGRVHLVQSKHNTRFYAIKVLAKEKVVRLKQVEHTNSERYLLGLCKHPFLVNLWGTFQDQHNLFMVMDFVAGGELFTLIRKSVRFPPTVAKFYAAEVATALEYLHQMDIIYRDLKPENILLGQDGHVKLTDFGFAKRVTATEKTYTMCGTPDYLAPEIILSQGYTQSVDWYAWGVLIFEMLAGHPPFYTKNSDPSQLYRKIIEGHVRYPAQIDARARDLIAHCLTPDLSKRYGNGRRGGSDIFQHVWFAEVNWEMLVRKEIPAPYIPALKGEGDSSQFEAYAENDPANEYGKTGPDPFEDFFVDFC
ncbi:kinase-like protein [Clavulina sp. PMI_390]|nr:kinase-like protein [Clavulina sp. PMI_390]